MTTASEKVVATHFDDYASSHKWQDLYEKPLNRDNVAFALRLDFYVDILRDLKPRSVLDLGCGSGDYLLALPDRSVRYHGADISSEMIRSAKEKIQKLPPEQRDQTSFEAVAITDMDPSKKYDFVLASGFIEYFDDCVPIVNKMAELVASGGHCVTQVPNRMYFKFKGVTHWREGLKEFAHHRMTGEECDELHIRAGLKKVEGFYFDHMYFAKSRKWFPKLHYWLDRNFAKITPTFISRRRATGYIGVYRKD